MEWRQREFEKKDTSKMADLSTAIMDKKRSPNRLIVDEATNDDNSVSKTETESLRWLKEGKH